MHSSILALGLAALFKGAFAQNNSYSQYSIKTTYDSSNFFEAFEFFNEKDPTNGFVDYVDADAANSEGLAGYVDGAVYMGVDYQTKNPSNGRRSVRVTSHDAFTHGLFIADIAHMPGSIPGVWPAYWMFGPNWPTSGEIDILEGVNTQTENKISLHTGPGCSITNDGTTQGTTLESENCDSAGASAGCGQNTSDNQNYGDGFNDIGGGVYATEWTSDHIAVWFFHRGRIPQDIQSGNPTPSSWGPPAAKFNGGHGCNIDDHFKENNIVFDTTFCGDWAGSPDVWGKNPETSSLGDCKDYVANNPADFKNAYWLVNSIKVYVQGGSYGGGGNGTTGGGNSGSGNSGSGNSGNGNSGNGNSGNGNSGNGNSGNGNSGNGNSGNGNSGNGNSGNGNSGNGNSGNGQSGNGDGQTNPPSSTQPGQDTQNGQQGQNGDGYSPGSQQGQGGGYSTGQSYDNGQYHGPGAYKATKSQPSGTTSWDGNGWRVGSKRSVISKRYLA
ncbi:mixed-linked glucanase precursor MLG1 [Fusarium pseudoanthophilum]|uniref:endo-1,3(4)-beta-glucanase n=1 Tax=Fusarium pseudoanthophilum TaxID=48495 RepID=A0A8H5KEY5_9HYPO|nr:mixed-linked glucanase precursor MLG1 [Fusarium pseudoanthophilum]